MVPVRRIDCEFTLFSPLGNAAFRLGSAVAMEVPAGTTIREICADVDTGEITFNGDIVWPGPAGPPPPAGPVAPPAPADLAAEAEAELVLVPSGVRSWPPSGDVLVGLETWFHVDGWNADERTATAGGVSSTVQAEPVRAVWHLGETDLTCLTAGTVYGSGSEHTDCGYTFARYTGGIGSASVDVVYHLTWSSNLGPGGDLGEVTRTTAFPLRVWEAQAVIE